MITTGTIVFVEDDEDDMYLYKIILKDLGIEGVIEWLTNADDAFEYLLNSVSPPFIIICDLNLPRMNGISFKLKIDANETLRKKSIPFVFLSTAADKYIIEKAYTEMTVQGFFKKSSNFEEMKDIFDSIIHYWLLCKHPNSI